MHILPLLQGGGSTEAILVGACIAIIIIIIIIIIILRKCASDILRSDVARDCIGWQDRA